MNIDNSRANTFRTCPWMYYEAFVRNGTGVEPKPQVGDGYAPLELGARVHELLEEYYKRVLEPIYKPSVIDPLEEEAKWIVSEYARHYPNDNWRVIDVERTFKIPLPILCSICYGSVLVYVNFSEPTWYCSSCGSHFKDYTQHFLMGKIDLFIQDLEDEKYYIVDHKTEKRGAKSNIPQKWAARDQASLYLWVAQQIYKEPVSNFVVNVLTRPSEKGRVGPSFPDRQKLERSATQLEIASRDIVVVADEIERFTHAFGDKPWPANRENCYGWGFCDYYLLHGYGESIEEILKYKYQPRKEYLDIPNI